MVTLQLFTSVAYATYMGSVPHTMCCLTEPTNRKTGLDSQTELTLVADYIPKWYSSTSMFTHYVATEFDTK